MSASLDSSLDPMEEIRFRKKHGAMWAEIQKDTHFTFDELEQIMVIFFKIQKRDEKPVASDLISRAHFRDVLHTGLGMTDSYMMERVMVALDRGTSPYVTMATFAKAMSLYLRGDLEERIAYAFTCYDLLSEGHLRRETMYQLMKKSLAKASRDDDVEEAVKELVDIMLKRMDVDLDGVINFHDFHETIVRTPSLLESLGYCLPERPAVYAFIATWCPSWKKIPYMFHCWPRSLFISKGMDNDSHRLFKAWIDGTTTVVMRKLYSCPLTPESLNFITGPIKSVI